MPQSSMHLDLNPHDPDERPGLHVAFGRGVNDAQRGKPITACPYDAATPEASAWLDGHVAGRTADRPVSR